MFADGKSPSKRKQVTGPVGLSGTQTLSGNSPGLRLRPEFVHPGCTNIKLPLWSERGVGGNEDRRHFRLCNLVAQGPRDAKGEFKREVEKERN